jgi:hypothetical protein
VIDSYHRTKTEAGSRILTISLDHAQQISAYFNQFQPTDRTGLHKPGRACAPAQQLVQAIPSGCPDIFKAWAVQGSNLRHEG